MTGRLSNLLGSSLILIAIGAPALAQAPPAQPPPVVSPEIAANRDVTLRLRAPSAERVELVSGGDIPGVPFQGGLPLAKGADGVFSVMLPALAAGAYRYRFTVDGVPTGDPSNPRPVSPTATPGACSTCRARRSWTRSASRTGRWPR